MSYPNYVYTHIYVYIQIYVYISVNEKFNLENSNNI